MTGKERLPVLPSGDVTQKNVGRFDLGMGGKPDVAGAWHMRELLHRNVQYQQDCALAYSSVWSHSR